MTEQIYVTSYTTPDLDGTACTYGYAEFLNKIGKSAQGVVFGTIHRETQFVLHAFKIPPLLSAEKCITKKSAIILVDASDRRGISSSIQNEQVIEIIDHRKINEAHLFRNAKVQIELVGSAATLIAEKFFSEKIKPSKEAAALLYSAIISNTINFKASVTTPRDHTMAKYLLSFFEIPLNYIHKMFSYKSIFQKSLKETILDDFATFNFGGFEVGIAQLEIIDVNSFITKNISPLESILQKIKQEEKLDYIFLSFIDLDKGNNIFFVIDNETKQLLEKVLEITFKDSIANKEPLLMRKQIVPLLKEYLECTDFHQSKNKE